MIWGGRNEVQFDPLLPPTYIFFDPQLTPYNIFLTKMLYGGVHARLSMKNLYGGACKIFYVCKTRGVIQYFHVFPGGHTTFLFHKGSCNIFVFKEVHNILYVSETQMPFTVNPGPRPQHCLNSDCNFTN